MTLRLALLLALTMTAFAANSILNRMAVGSGGITPETFAYLRVASGTLILALLALVRRTRLPMGRRQLVGAPALAVYMIGFSLAYRTLDAGVGALILFGAVQMSMFLIAAAMGHRSSVRQVAGAAAAFAGLALILWPGAGWQAEPVGAALMVAAGIGWGVYTLAGRGAADPLAATGANFLLTLPMVALAARFSGGFDAAGNWTGFWLAIISGAVTSGLGYALWYAVLPRIEAATAALVQLSAPVIAVAGGTALLGEVPSPQFLAGAVLVLGGIAFGIAPRRAR